MTAEVAPPPVVRKDKHNVWPGSSIGLFICNGRTSYEQKAAQYSNGQFHELPDCNRGWIGMLSHVRESLAP